MVLERVKAALKLHAWNGNESGQTLVEYSLIIGLIAVAAIIGITLVAGGIDSLWGWIGDEVSTAVDDVLS
jgi:Flp pilus assembly pilin Flp